MHTEQTNDWGSIKDSTGMKVSAPPSGPLDELQRLLSEQASRVYAAAARVNRVADQLLGPIPVTADCGRELDPTVFNAARDISDALMALDDAIGRLQQ